jgi:GNAT superfamily N-acetyltransferase
MEQKVQQYKIVRASRENISALSQLFFESKGVRIPVEYLKQKFNTDYTGKSYFAHFAMTDDDKPAAFFCLFPCYVFLNGKKVLAGQSADIITHPDHQRKGLFSLLGKATESLAQAEGIKILFAFPNENSYPGFVRSLNWHHPNNFVIYRFKVKGFSLYRALSKFKLGWFYKQYARIIKNRYLLEPNKFQGSIPRNMVNSGHRSNEFYQYKEFNKNFFVEFKGLKFWCKIDGYLWIGDIFYDEGIEINKLVTILKEFTVLLGLDEFIFEVSQNSLWDQLLKEVANFTKGVAIVYKNLDDINEAVPLEFTGGDIDVF